MWAISGTLLAFGCQTEGSFLCSEAADCTIDNVEGVCQPNRYCSFPAPNCPSGQRYGELGPAGIAGECVLPGVDDGLDTAVADGTTGDATGGPTQPGTTSTTSSTTSDEVTSVGTRTGPEVTTATSDVTTGTPLDSSLLLWLELEVFDGDVALDSSSYDLNPTCTAECPTLVPGQVGSAGSFSAGHALMVADGAPFEASEYFTLAVWIRATGVPMQAGTIMQKPLGGGTLTTPSSWALRVLPTPAPSQAVVAFEIATSMGPTSVQSPISIGEWTHVAATYDRGDVVVYVDGEVVSFNSGNPIVFDGSGLYFGATLDAVNLVQHFVGDIDDVRIYERVLSGDEIEDLPGF